MYSLITNSKKETNPSELFKINFLNNNINKDIINNIMKHSDSELNSLAYKDPQAQSDTESALIFQRIRSRADLHLPSFYKILLDILLI